MASTMPSIDIGIPEAQRQEIAQGLSRLLADTYVLYGNTHGFHWNVTGPMFNTLHLMFMDQYTELWTALDVIAERIRALGGRRTPWRHSPRPTGLHCRSAPAAPRPGDGPAAGQRP